MSGLRVPYPPESPFGIEADHHIRAGGVVHANGFSRHPASLLACRGRVAASDIESAGDAMVTCLWCLTGKIDETLRWFKWGDGT